MRLIVGGDPGGRFHLTRPAELPEVLPSWRRRVDRTRLARVRDLRPSAAETEGLAPSSREADSVADGTQCLIDDVEVVQCAHAVDAGRTRCVLFGNPEDVEVDLAMAKVGPEAWELVCCRSTLGRALDIEAEEAAVFNQEKGKATRGEFDEPRGCMVSELKRATELEGTLERSKYSGDVRGVPLALFRDPSVDDQRVQILPATNGTHVRQPRRDAVDDATTSREQEQTWRRG